MPQPPNAPPVPLTHFVGFRRGQDPQAYANAVRIFGAPDCVHHTWDIYAANDIAPGDTVVFAKGEADRPPRSFSSEAARGRKARRERQRNQDALATCFSSIIC